MLVRLRIAAARRALLETSTSITAIASDVGFASLSAFHENFRKYTAMSPGDYRRMREASTFIVSLPKDYPAERMLGFLGRDSGSLTDRVDGATWSSAVRLGATVGAHLRVAIRPGFAQCDVLDPGQVDTAGMGRIYAHVMSSLGLTHDPLRFEAQVDKSPELAPLIQGQRGLRIPMVGQHFDFLAWAIIGQQITLTFAYTLRRRLIELAGQPIAAGLFLAPTSETVAALADQDLVQLGFSRAKAAYLIGAAQAVLDGRLPLEQLAGKSATRIERLLLAARGIGPWTANYMLMRSYGFLDCVPVGDTGLTASLQQFFKLAQRPDRQVTLALMEPFRPYRSLATFHLWQRHAHPQIAQPARASVAVVEVGDAVDLGR
jgi:AraC family transcriptional regulator of adaptative response / DNA-3-methyladenine glycosylase II